jgi:hypothetical protein
MYIFMHWFCRRHRALIKGTAEGTILLMQTLGKEILDEIYYKNKKEIGL